MGFLVLFSLWNFQRRPVIPPSKAQIFSSVSYAWTLPDDFLLWVWDTRVHKVCKIKFLFFFIFMFNFVNFQANCFEMYCAMIVKQQVNRKKICEFVFHSTRLGPLLSGIFIRIFTKYLYVSYSNRGWNKWFWDTETLCKMKNTDRPGTSEEADGRVWRFSLRRPRRFG